MHAVTTKITSGRNLCRSRLQDSETVPPALGKNSDEYCVFVYLTTFNGVIMCGWGAARAVHGNRWFK